jgi:predicted Kef-type K+ transport protein
MPRLQSAICIVLFVIVMLVVKFLLVPWLLVSYGWVGIAGLIALSFLYGFRVEAEKRQINR